VVSAAAGRKSAWIDLWKVKGATSADGDAWILCRAAHPKGRQE